MNANTEKTSKGKCRGYKCFVCCCSQKGRKQRKQPNEKRQNNVNCNPENETTLTEDVPPKEVTSPFKEVTSPFKEVTSPFKEVTSPFKEVTSPFKEAMHSGEENNDQTKYVNDLVEKFERLLSYEIQQFKLATTSPSTLMQDVPSKEVTSPFKEVTSPFKEVTSPFKEAMHSEEENNEQMSYENNDHIKYVNDLVEKFERLLTDKMQQFQLETSPRQKNVNSNPENETIVMEEVPPKEVTSPFKEAMHSEQENNDQINYENNDHIKYVNYLVEKAEKLLSYEIQQFKLATSPSTLMKDVPSKEVTSPFKEAMHSEEENNDHMNYENNDHSSSNTPLFPVQKSSKLRLPLDQHLLDDRIYKKYLDEEFKILIPYEDEETKHDTSSWTTSVLYSQPVRQPSRLRLLLNKLLPEEPDTYDFSNC